MALISFLHLKKWLIRIGILIFSCIIIFWAGAHLFVPGFIKKSVSEFAAKIGSGSSKLLEFKKLVITVKWTKLALGELGFDEILLVEPKMLVEKGVTKSGHSGAWNWQELIAAIEKSMPPKDNGEPNKPLKMFIDEPIVSSASLSLKDNSSKLKEELKSVTIKLLDVANYDKQGVVTGIRGQYDFNLGALQILVPGINKMIAYQRVAIAGRLDNPQPGKLGVQLNIKLDDGVIRSH